ncbi:MAG: putative glutathione peroxidase [Frankiales bacterium]|nr:putative glutathione peroxidase [Frankiales bacterium]
MTLLNQPVQLLDGTSSSLGDLLSGGVALVVNVASKCGLTPQYSALQSLHEEYDDLTVLGFPCNQFGGQEPGTEDEIVAFCSASYGTTFPMAAKALVNGRHADPLWESLTATPDAEGKAGEVLWNFEKFLIDRTGQVVARFRPLTDPAGPEVRAAVEKALAS